MFPSLDLLRPIGGPICRTEIKFLRQADWTNPWIRRGSRALIAFAILVASLPLWIYITDDFPTYLLLPLMGIVIYAVQFMVGIRCLMLATYTISREWQLGTWDSLVLTGANAKKILLGKWWAVMCRVWPMCIPAALLRAGFVYGLVQFFVVVSTGGCFKISGGPLCYYTNIPVPIYGVDYSYPYNYPYPSLWFILFSILLLVGFGLLEAGLLTALGILSALLAHRHQTLGITIAGIARITLILLAVGSWQFVELHRMDIRNTLYESFSSWTNYWNSSYSRQYRFLDSLLDASVYLPDTLQLTISSLGDDGVLAITDFMRPAAVLNFRLQRALAILCGLGMYATLLSLCLGLAERLMVRAGALRAGDG